MDVSVLQAFIKPEMGILLAALWVVGYAVKKFPKIADEWIIFIVSAVGILGASAISKSFSVDSVLQGIICAACAVYGNQTIRQIQKMNNKEDDSNA